MTVAGKDEVTLVAHQSCPFWLPPGFMWIVFWENRKCIKSIFFKRANTLNLVGLIYFHELWFQLGLFTIHIGGLQAIASVGLRPYSFVLHISIQYIAIYEASSSLFHCFSGFSGHSDINKALEISLDVKRISNQLKECQTLAQLYNQRERLFGTPVTQYDKVRVYSNYILT